MLSRIDIIVWIFRNNGYFVLFSFFGLVTSILISYAVFIAVFLVLLIVSLIFELVRSTLNYKSTGSIKPKKIEFEDDIDE